MVQQGLYHSQNLSLRQEQQLAPHQIQSLEILMAPLMDLQGRINQELAENPTLERQESSLEQMVGDPVEDMSTAISTEDQAGMAAEFDENLTGLVQLDSDWRDYVEPSHAKQVFSSDDEERRRHYF